MIFNYRINRVRILLSIIFLFSIPNFTPAQNYGSENMVRPHLGNHAFIMNNNLDSPFINTFYSNSLGYGESLNFSVPVIIIDNKPLFGLRGDISFLNINFGYQYAVNNWLALFIKTGLTARFGSEAQSIVAEGLNSNISAEIGWIFKLYQTNSYIISLKASLNNKSGTYLNLFKFIEGIIDSSGFTDDNHLLYSGSFLQGTGSVLFAWAINKNFGFVSNLQIGYGETIDNTASTKIYYRAAFSFDYDLSKDYPSWPLGFAIGFISDSFSDSDDISIQGSSNSFFYNIAYTGKKDLLLGLDIKYVVFPFRNTTQDLKTVNTSFNIKYFFN